MIQGNFRLSAPNDAKATLSITMSIREWRELNLSMRPYTGYTVSNVQALIAKLIRSADEGLFATVEVDRDE